MRQRAPPSNASSRRSSGDRTQPRAPRPARRRRPHRRRVRQRLPRAPAGDLDGVALVRRALPVVGTTVNRARLWVKLAPLQFQPGELSKIMLIVFRAGYLREKREVLAQGRPKDFGPLLVIWGGAMLVLVETGDLGSALLFFGIFLAMLYVATARFHYVAAGGLLFLAGAVGAYRTIPHVRD